MYAPSLVGCESAGQGREVAKAGKGSGLHKRLHGCPQELLSLS